MQATRSPASWPRVVVAAAVAAFIVALVVGFELVRPFVAGPVGFDSAASVIHFDRIVAGRHLEALVTATPKPFLTAAYGLLHAVTGDWRSISWATIGAFACCVALGGVFAWRIAGPIAGLFAAAALLGSRTLLADVVIAYAIPWAMVGWLLAGLVMVGPRPRPALAGVFLCLAALARLETLVVIGIALLAVLVSARPVRRGASRETWRHWLLAIGLLALPVMLVHDWLLTGDPLFWLSVSQRYSQAAPDSVMTPLELGSVMIRHYVGMPVLTGLAILGFVVLARQRKWVAIVGLWSLSVGVAVFLELLAARGTYVSPRYLAAIDMAVVIAASVGAAALVEIGARGARATVGGREQTWLRPVPALMVLSAIILAAASVWPVASLNASFRGSAESQRMQAEHADSVLPPIASELDGIPGAGSFPPPDAPMRGDPAAIVLLVPGLERPRFAVDLSLPLSQVGGTPAAWLVPGEGFLPAGDIIYHDRLADRDKQAFAILEVDVPTAIGDVTLSPLVADPVAGIWVQRIQR
jgi:hypothetical protein